MTRTSVSARLNCRLLALVLVCASSLASVAQATVLSGTFSGTAVAGSSFLSVPGGTPMSGTFMLDLGYPFTLSSSDGSTFAHYEAANFEIPPDPVHITFSAPSFGWNWDYDGLGFLHVDLGQTASGQSIHFSTAYPKGSSAEITLAGGLGSLFDSFDLASVHEGPLNVIGSFAHFDQTAGIGNDIVFDGVAFDAPVPVPEPSSGLLACLGVMAIWVDRRRKCKQR